MTKNSSFCRNTKEILLFIKCLRFSVSKMLEDFFEIDGALFIKELDLHLVSRYFSVYKKDQEFTFPFTWPPDIFLFMKVIRNSPFHSKPNKSHKSVNVFRRFIYKKTLLQIGGSLFIKGQQNFLHLYLALRHFLIKMTWNSIFYWNSKKVRI